MDENPRCFGIGNGDSRLANLSYTRKVYRSPLPLSQDTRDRHGQLATAKVVCRRHAVNLLFCVYSVALPHSLSLLHIHTHMT